jgi:hypothetical protein
MTTRSPGGMDCAISITGFGWRELTFAAEAKKRRMAPRREGEFKLQVQRIWTGHIPDILDRARCRGWLVRGGLREDSLTLFPVCALWGIDLQNWRDLLEGCWFHLSQERDMGTRYPASGDDLNRSPGRIWRRFVVSHPSAIRLRKNGARRFEAGAGKSKMRVGHPPDE